MSKCSLKALAMRLLINLPEFHLLHLLLASTILKGVPAKLTGAVEEHYRFHASFLSDTDVNLVPFESKCNE